MKDQTIAAGKKTENRSALRHGVGVILLASVLIGAMAVCVQLAARKMVPEQIVFFRFAGALVLLLVFGHPRALRPQARSVPAILLRALFGVSAILLYFRGIGGAGAGLATLLQCTYPVHTALLAAVFTHEPFSRRIAAALALNLLGAAMVLGPAAGVGPEVLSGALCALGASILAGAAITTIRHLRRRETALLLTTHFMALGTLCTAPALLAKMPAWSPELLLALLGIIVTSALAQLLLHQGLGFASATEGSLAAAASVVSAAAFESAFLGTAFGVWTLAGGALLVAAVGLAASAGRGRRCP